MVLQIAGKSVDDFLNSVQELPWLVHGLALFLLISGVILWMYGRKVLKPMIVVLFGIIGAGVGVVLPPLTGTGGPTSIYVGLGVGAIVGALLGAMLYRFAMAVGFGLVLAVIAPLTCAAVLGISVMGTGASGADKPARIGTADGTHEPDGDAEAAHDLTDELIRRGEKLKESIKDSLKSPPPPEGQDPATDVQHRAVDEIVDHAVKNAWERIRTFLDSLWAEVGPQWAALPTSQKMTLGGSTALGFAAGFIIGMLLPKWASGTVTAMLGAGIWLTAVVWLSTAFDAPWASHLHRSAAEWLVIWGAVSLVGMLIQWRGIREKKSKHPKKIIVQTE